MMQEKRVDIFGTFLTAPADAAPAPAPIGIQTHSSAPELERAVLGHIVQAEAPVGLRDLVALVPSAGPTQILKLLKDMEDVGLIEKSADQSYVATALGKELAGAR